MKLFSIAIAFIFTAIAAIFLLNPSKNGSNFNTPTAAILTNEQGDFSHAATAELAADYSAGFIALTNENDEDNTTLDVGIWYPSTDAEQEGKLGPFRPTWAWQGAIAVGKFPVIVLSHGNSGKYRNHGQTAAYLARLGYIVIAPDHTPDKTMTSVKRFPPVMSIRTTELKTVLELLSKYPQIIAQADMNRIGAIGYSLGTMTALMAGGTTPEIPLFFSHCDKYAESDPNFCGYKLLGRLIVNLRRAIAYLGEIGILDPEKRRQSNRQKEDFTPLAEPINFRAIALVAPVGAVFSAARLKSLNSNIAIFRLGDDKRLASPYHAERLRDLAGNKVQVYKTFTNTHHYAFINPIPKWLLDILQEKGEDISVMLDPPGFDRAAFIDEINVDIGQFFANYLSAN